VLAFGCSRWPSGSRRPTSSWRCCSSRPGWRC
jgi:hypothetical protein